jgi:hypothetical protein
MHTVIYGVYIQFWPTQHKYEMLRRVLKLMVYSGTFSKRNLPNILAFVVQNDSHKDR